MDCDVEINENGSFSSLKLKKESDRLADNVRENLKDFFEVNEVDGSVFVMLLGGCLLTIVPPVKLSRAIML